MMTLLEKIDFWVAQRGYEFNLQLWGDGNNHCYINKDDVELKIIPQKENPTLLLKEVLRWCEKSNPRIKYPNSIL